MKISCLIVDDEPLASDIIEEYLSRIEGYEVVAKCSTALQAFSILSQKKVDLMFLDIQMPKLTGIDFLRSLRNPPKVILTTAYSEYALEGYELDVVDYLLKPISFERFLHAIDKASKQLLTYTAPSTSGQQVAPSEPYIYVREDKITQKIFLSEILYIESQGNYVKIVCTERVVTSYSSISLIEEKLPEAKFLRVHRSFIVATDKITAFSGTTIMIGKHQIPIGRSYKTLVEQKLNVE